MLISVILILSSTILTSANRSLLLKVVAPLATAIDFEDFRIATIVSNTGSETLRLLRDPRSPLSTLPTEKFRIVNSKSVHSEFSGIRVRYDPETDARSGRPESVVELGPGGSITIEHVRE
jgi:peptidyl-Lys metalloendopeptidase